MPTLSNASIRVFGRSIRIQIDTDNATGALHYQLTNAFNSSIDVATIKAAATNQLVIAAGTQEIWLHNVTEFTSGSILYAYVVHTDNAASDSNIPIMSGDSINYNEAQRGIPELHGKIGVGIRKVCQSRRTDTTAFIEVSIGNVSDAYYNSIHCTKVTDIHTLLQNKTNATLTVTAMGVPVVAERVQQLTGINITNDPLVRSANSRLNNDANDPIDWDGLLKRRFKFTELDDKWYDAYVDTDLVAEHGSGGCKHVHIRFRPKRKAAANIINVGCFQGLNPEDPKNDMDVPVKAARKIVQEGFDYATSPDDPDYARATIDKRWWLLPRDSNSSAPWDPPGTLDIFGSLINTTINVGDVSTDDEFLAVQEALTASMNPAVVIIGYQGVYCPTDIGDHGIRRGNNLTMDVYTFQPALQSYLTLSYDATVFDIYTESGAVMSDIHSDMAVIEKWRANTMYLFDHCYYCHFEHNHVSDNPDVAYIPNYYNGIEGITNIFNALGAGGIGADPYCFRPRWKFMDVGNFCRVYATDMSFFSYLHESDISDPATLPNVLAVGQVSGTQQIADIAVDVGGLSSSYKYIGILSGDCIYPTNGEELNSQSATFGQPDGMAEKFPLEHSAFRAAYENAGKLVGVFTSDFHAIAITKFLPNVMHLHASLAGLSGAFTVPMPASQTHTHQKLGGKIGYIRAHISASEFSAVAMVGSDDLVDVYDTFSDRAVSDGNSFKFEIGDGRKVVEPKGVKISNQNFSTIRVR